MSEPINYIFYARRYDVNSGGELVPFMACKHLSTIYSNIKCYIAHDVSRGDGISTQQKNNNIDFHGRSINYIDELEDSYFDKTSYNYPAEYLDLLVTKDILLKRNNVAIYNEGILGNPLEQQYVIRWIMYFTTPGLPVDPYFAWGKNDKFMFWDLSYLVNKDTKYYGINDHKLYTTEYYPENDDIYIGKHAFIPSNVDKHYHNTPSNNIRSGSCHMIRKADPNYNRTMGQNWNFETEKPNSPVFIHPPDSLLIDTLELCDVINIFKKKEYFYCYDLYTFYNSIAILYGCTVIMCPPECELSKQQWHCGNESYLNYVAWGNNETELINTKTSLENVNYIDVLEKYILKCNEEFIMSFNELNKHFIKTKTEEIKSIINYNKKEMFNDNYVGLKLNTDDLYKNYAKQYDFYGWNFEVNFLVLPNNVNYANILCFNYADEYNVNMGPRLEIAQNMLSLIMGNKYEWKGYTISNINFNCNYYISVQYISNNLYIKLVCLDDGTITETTHHIIFKPKYFKNLVLGKGFNEERYFKGIIENFKFNIM